MTDALHVNLHDFEAAARALIPPVAFDFIVGGAGDEVTLNENRTAFARWRLLPSVLTGVATPDLTTEVLGQQIAHPVLIPPMGLQRLAHPDGELASARAARRAGTIFCLSCAGSSTIEDVAANAGAWWFQIYFVRDHAVIETLVRRAETAGASAIVVTVDAPVRGRREADLRNRFALPEAVTMPNLRWPDGQPATASALGDDPPTYASMATWDLAVTWRDLERIVGLTRLPVVVKGILSPEDARLAIAHGARGVIVSNHGGRQLDSAIASLDALPAVADALAGDGEIFLDGGVRRGTDVVKALALGARAVLVGRPILYGLAVAGEDGAFTILDLLRQELLVDLTLLGRPSLPLNRSLLVKPT